MAPPYDLILKGGHLIDPKNNIDTPNQVAIKDGKIAAIAPDLPDTATQIIDVSGLYITPGLIDIHMHAYGGFNAWLFPDPHYLNTGTTTVVDTGSAGWQDFENFKDTIMDNSVTRVLAFLNIAGGGMTGAPEQDTNGMSARRCADTILQYPQHLVGTKSAHFGGLGWESTGGAIEAARLSNSITMVDFSPKPERTYAEMLARFSPGDIHTHVYSTRTTLLNDQQQVNDYAWQARQRGIIFDTGHGNQSFYFHIAVPAMQQGFPPDTISTDLHRRSRLLSNATMDTTMSKFLALGMPLQEVIYRSTWRPAEVIRRPDLGHLSVGAEADLAVLDVLEGDFKFVDSTRSHFPGRHKLQCHMTLRAGEVVWDMHGRSFPLWSDCLPY
jgi:dihydroorotase